MNPMACSSCISLLSMMACSMGLFEGRFRLHNTGRPTYNDINNIGLTYMHFQLSMLLLLLLLLQWCMMMSKEGVASGCKGRSDNAHYRSEGRRGVTPHGTGMITVWLWV